MVVSPFGFTSPRVERRSLASALQCRYRMRVVLLATAACLGAPLARAETPATGTDSGRDTARHDYEQGLAHAARGDYTLALGEFRKAYAASPHYAVLYNIGQAELALGRPLAAVEALSGYLRDGGGDVPPERAEQVRKQIAELSVLFAAIGVEGDLPGASIAVDGREVGPAPLAAPVKVQAGTHVVTATRDGTVIATQVVTLKEGEKTSVDLSAVAPSATPTQSTPEPAANWRPPPAVPAERRGVSIPLGYVVAGAGVALAGGTLAHYFWNRGRHERWLESSQALEDPSTPDREELQKENNDLADSIDRASVVTVVMAASSAALVLAGVAIEVGGAFGGPTAGHAASVSWRGVW